GSVAHLRPTPESVAAEEQIAWPKWVVSPRFMANARSVLEPIPKDHGLLRLASNAFNYELQGVRGFRSVARMARACDFYDLTFGNLNEAVTLLNQLSETP
ncbi:MAG: HprK-related kinase A, partial [Magnetococcales bacterium]|nr:HprK-related kinase A [Magnetococcales bacterium]